MNVPGTGLLAAPLKVPMFLLKVITTVMAAGIILPLVPVALVYRTLRFVMGLFRKKKSAKGEDNRGRMAYVWKDGWRIYGRQEVPKWAEETRRPMYGHLKGMEESKPRLYDVPCRAWVDDDGRECVAPEFDGTLKFLKDQNWQPEEEAFEEDDDEWDGHDCDDQCLGARADDAIVESIPGPGPDTFRVNLYCADGDGIGQVYFSTQEEVDRFLEVHGLSVHYYVPEPPPTDQLVPPPPVPKRWAHYGAKVAEVRCADDGNGHEVSFWNDDNVCVGAENFPTMEDVRECARVNGLTIRSGLGEDLKKQMGNYPVRIVPDPDGVLVAIYSRDTNEFAGQKFDTLREATEWLEKEGVTDYSIAKGWQQKVVARIDRQTPGLSVTLEWAADEKEPDVWPLGWPQKRRYCSHLKEAVKWLEMQGVEYSISDSRMPKSAIIENWYPDSTKTKSVGVQVKIIWKDDNEQTGWFPTKDEAEGWLALNMIALNMIRDFTEVEDLTSSASNSDAETSEKKPDPESSSCDHDWEITDLADSASGLFHVTSCCTKCNMYKHEYHIEWSLLGDSLEEVRSMMEHFRDQKTAIEGMRKLHPWYAEFHHSPRSANPLRFRVDFHDRASQPRTYYGSLWAGTKREMREIIIKTDVSIYDDEEVVKMTGSDIHNKQCVTS